MKKHYSHLPKDCTQSQTNLGYLLQEDLDTVVVYARLAIKKGIQVLN